MAISNFDEALAGIDNRTLVVNDKKYHSKTGNRCPACADERYLYVKQRIGTDQAALECPWCDSTSTVHVGMIFPSKG